MTEFEKEKERRMQEFYNSKLLLSYSAANKMLRDPADYFDWYIMKEQEDKNTRSSILGNAIHCLILDEFSFDNKYIVEEKVPGSDMMVAYLGALVKGLSEEEAYELSGYSYGIERVKKEAEKFDKYFKQLKNEGGQKIISSAEKEHCLQAKEAILKDNAICRLMGINADMRDIEVFNELYLEFDGFNKFPGKLGLFTFGLKGIIDNLVIDHDDKIIYINDLKNMFGKSLSDFTESIEYWKYWLQATIYNMLVIYNYSHKYKDYTIVFHFIVVDRFLHVYPFKVTDATSEEWAAKSMEVLEKFNWHYENREYKLPYDFANGLVKL